MPKEFQDFADDMGKAIDPVADSLANVRKLADEADTSYSKFASSVVASSNKISGVVANVEKSLGDIGKKSDDLSKKSGSLNKSIEGASKQLENFEKSVPKKVESKFLTSLQKDIDAAQLELERMKAGMIKMDFDKVLKLEVEISKLGELSKWTDSLSDAQKETNDFVLANYKLDGSLDAIIRKNDALGASILSAETATKEQVASMQESSRESRKVASATDFLKKKLDEGADSAESFANGLGANSGVMMGVAVAAVYVANKIDEMGGSLVDARVDLAKFNVDMTSLENQLSLAGFTGSIEKVRSELDLTREQSQEFVGVMMEADKAGVIAADQFVEVAKEMKDAFGGDQVKRLQDFVGLLKQLPNLMEDFSSTADPANLEAAIFALGELDQLGEAGALFGQLGKGIDIDVKDVSQENKDFANSAKKTERIEQDIKDVLLSTLPEITPQVTAIAGGVLSLGTKVFSGFAVMGALTKMLGTKQDATTAAVYGKAAGGGPAPLLGGKGAKAAKGAGKLAKLGSTLGKVAMPTALIATVANMGLNVAAEKTENKTAKKALKGGASAAGIVGGAATGAAIGSMILPGWGTAIGGVIGAAIPAYSTVTEMLGDTAEKVEEFGSAEEQATAKINALIASEDVEERQKGLALRSGIKRAKMSKKHDAVFNEGTFLLQKFNSEVASTELAGLEEIGPITGSFNDAIKGAKEAFKAEFSAKLKQLEKDRKDVANEVSAGILTEKDGNLMRRKIDQQEMAARGEFVGNMLIAAAALLDFPELIANKIKGERLAAKFDVQQKGGMFDFSKGFAEMAANRDKSIALMLKSGAGKELQEAHKELREAEAGGDAKKIQLAQKELRTAEKEVEDLFAGLTDNMNTALDGMDKTVAVQERVVKEAEGAAVAALKVGNAIEGEMEAVGENLKLMDIGFREWKKGVALIKEDIANQEGNVKSAAEALEKLKKRRDQASRAEKGALTDQIDTEESVLVQLEAHVGSVKESLADKMQELGDVMEKGLSLEEVFDKALTAAGTGKIGRRIAGELDFSEALGASAEFRNDFARVSAQSTAIALAAIEDRRDIEMKAAVKARAEGIKDVQLRMKIAKEMGQDPEAVRQQGMAEVAARFQNAKFKAEADANRDNLEKIQERANIEDRVLDIQRDSVDTELDFLNEIGGAFSSIMALQEKGIAIEQKKLAIYQEELKAVRDAKLGGAALQDAELKVFKQRLEIEKQAMGAQKDVADKLLGRAFGAIRGELGAARGRGGAVGLLGRDRTRVMNRAGTFVEGDAMPIAERAARMNIARLGGGGGAGVPGLRGQLGQMLPAVGGAAQRMPFEAGLAKGLGRGGAIDLKGGKMVDIGAAAPPPAPIGVGGGFRQAGPELPPPIPVEASMKAEVRVTFDNKMFREQVIQIVNQEVLGGRTSKDLKNKMDQENTKREGEMQNMILRGANSAGFMNSRSKSSNANISPGLGVS